MKILVERVPKDYWNKNFAENAHKIAFKKVYPKEWERIDYALVAFADKEIIGYVTVREMDAESVYWQFGGGFPPGLGTIRIWNGYKAFLNWTASRYKRMTTLIENNNVAMLKLAMAAGLRITGVRYFKGEILLEHGIEFSSDSL